MPRFHLPPVVELAQCLADRDLIRTRLFAAAMNCSLKQTMNRIWFSTLLVNLLDDWRRVLVPFMGLFELLDLRGLIGIFGIDALQT